MSENEQIQEAETRKSKCAQKLRQAKRLLEQAQEDISCVEGVGSGDIYDQIADLYHDHARPLIERVENMKATGLFA